MLARSLHQSWSPSSSPSSKSAHSQPLSQAQDIWLVRLVVAGADGRSSPVASVDLEALHHGVVRWNGDVVWWCVTQVLLCPFIHAGCRSSLRGAFSLVRAACLPLTNERAPSSSSEERYTQLTCHQS